MKEAGTKIRLFTGTKKKRTSIGRYGTPLNKHKKRQRGKKHGYQGQGTK